MIRPISPDAVATDVEVEAPVPAVPEEAVTSNATPAVVEDQVVVATKPAISPNRQVAYSRSVYKVLAYDTSDEAGRWKNRRVILTVASRSVLSESEVKDIVTHTRERKVNRTLLGFDHSGVLHKLAKRHDLTREGAQSVIDESQLSFRRARTKRKIERAILKNPACKPFIHELRFEALAPRQVLLR